MSKVYQVKVTIMYIEPAIWRRLIIPSNITFHKFHKISKTGDGSLFEDPLLPLAR